MYCKYQFNSQPIKSDSVTDLFKKQPHSLTKDFQNEFTIAVKNTTNNSVYSRQILQFELL